MGGIPVQSPSAGGPISLSHAFRPRAPSDRGIGEGAMILAQKDPLSEMGELESALCAGPGKT